MTITSRPAHRARRSRQLGTGLHIAFYRLTGGLLGGNLGLARCLLLTTTGRKSGQRHTVPLAYFEIEGERCVVASNWGGEYHAAWYLNLLTNPRVEIQLGRRRQVATAVVAGPAERARLWPRLVAQMPVYARYQAGIGREIPVVLLKPIQA
ncbi:MAG TPA: nitroreductase/quinone reductase family protein [Ktedonobacterales bacterium]|nr:nitroreductase/quinone reductase family protein [Ktedonobacterales bacterium]